MTRYFRPLVQVGSAAPADARTLAGGWGWFTHVEVLQRAAASEIVPVAEAGDLSAFIDTRPAIAGLNWDKPHVMGILNTTPDSFSDGGHNTGGAGERHAQDMVAAGASLIDVGGESTRPGAVTVPVDEEVARTAPTIKALRNGGLTVPISIDTRKADVAARAIEAGADIANDVSGFTFDPALAPLCAARDIPVCVMHAQGDPATMQDAPYYENVILDVFDYLQDRINALVAMGIPRTQIIADPGIGFGKTQAHNLAILQNLSLYHGLGVPILLGASRKRFIGAISGASEAAARGPGSVGVALAALGQGVQLIRAHDVAMHVQAIALWRASVANV